MLTPVVEILLPAIQESLGTGACIFPDIDVEKVKISDMVVFAQIQKTPRKSRTADPEQPIVVDGIADVGVYFLKIAQYRAFVLAPGGIGAVNGPVEWVCRQVPISGSEAVRIKSLAKSPPGAIAPRLIGTLAGLKGSVIGWGYWHAYQICCNQALR